ncbi:MAG: tRNA preQ1(34) S-adenosylmethionine ribosyltransferase-isomerase QueA [Candidatus Edwardsbacteria bacterium]|nr:tRNA preQ1(34) S-adenosylmethionine ribosyltransferase-isomerase QueA [Candidatus Edwardsbacteria bacterium]
MKLSDFDYHLPKELIAQRPAEQRDQSRLLVLHKADGRIEHRHFHDIAEYLRPADCLIVNTTKVMPARLVGRKKSSGGEAEIFLLRQISANAWLCLVRPGRRLMPGAVVEFGQGELTGRIAEYQDQGRRLVEFTFNGEFNAVLEKIGHVPLPPYIDRKDEEHDRTRYQTVYAKETGAVAAPTAGLHFTPELLSLIRSKGVSVLDVLLHVGWGTFKSVEAEDIRKHRMDAEYYRIRPGVAEKLKKSEIGNRRIIAVGTTTVRALESFAQTGKLEGWTEIFIHPPCEFKLVDALVTNFHLPKSTLLMMVSAFAGVEVIRNAYREAVKEKYRFYSYGDAMLIV